MSLINVKVAGITEEAEGIRSFLLARTGLFRLPIYAPGAHIDVHCGKGIIRQYSLCGDPGDRRHFMIAVNRGSPSRGGSDLLHLSVRQGDRLEIGSPRNNFPLDEDGEHTILLAGGIGITPIIAMADRLHARGRAFELWYFSRGAARTAFRDRLLQGAFADKVMLHEGQGRDAVRRQLSTALADAPPQTQVYMCGPGPFMDTAKAIALRHLPPEAIRLERFAAKPALASGPTAPFTIELGRSGTTLTVGKNETILDVLEANGIDVAFSCEQGVCGTCVTDVIAGDPEHRDTFLSARQRAAGKQMCICVSRARSKTIVLDI